MTLSPRPEADPSEPSQNATHRRIALTLGTIVVAASVALMVAGEAGAGLVLLFWAAANWLGLPPVIFFAGVAISVLAAGYLALVLFLRVVRIDGCRARGESPDDVGWNIFRGRDETNRS